MKKKFSVTKGWFSELSTTESTFHFNDERTKFVKWWRFLLNSELLILAFFWSLISDCTDSMIWFDYFFSALPSNFSHVEQTITRYRYVTRNATVPIFEEDRRMCQYSRNNSIQFSSWTMIPLSWFPNFHILWVWTQEAESPSYPSVRSNLIAWFCLCAQDSQWMNHILHMSKWQKYSSFPSRL